MNIRRYCVVKPDSDYIEVSSIRSDVCQIGIHDTVLTPSEAEVQLSAENVKAFIGDLQDWLEEYHD